MATDDTIIGRLRAVQDCDTDGASCDVDSGPFCLVHERSPDVALLREAADALEAALRERDEARAKLAAYQRQHAKTRP
jgi:hypothetical protein